MYFKHAVTALAGLTSLAAAAPASIQDREAMPVDKGLKHLTRNQKRSPLIIQQTVVEPTVVVVEQNLDTINALAATAEQEFALLVQSQLALAQQLQTIQDNIRINHFRSRFNRVNTVIVCVTQVVDIRNADSQNNRYLVNQLLADNGFPQSEVVVMLTAAAPMTIGVPTPSLDIAGLLASASAVSAPTGSPSIASFDPNAPFGQLNQSVILPFGSLAPSLPNNAQIFADPAAIILPGQSNLFISDLSQFSSDCALWSSNGQSLFNLASSLIAAEQIAAAELAGLTIGTNPNAAAAAALLSQLQSGQGVNTVASSSTASASSASSASATAAATTAAAAVIGAAAPPAAAASGNGVGVQIVSSPPSEG